MLIPLTVVRRSADSSLVCMRAWWIRPLSHRDQIFSHLMLSVVGLSLLIIHCLVLIYNNLMDWLLNHLSLINLNLRQLLYTDRIRWKQD
jgi:hypothetical protein